MGASDVTILISFTTLEYVITYNNITGATNYNPTSINVESSEIKLTSPTKAGYTFGGWFDNSSLTGTAVTTITAGNIDGIQLWAKWTKVTVNVPITFTQPSNGIIAVTYNNSAVASGTTLAEGSVLSIEATPQTGYFLANITINGLTFTSKTYTVGTSEVKIEVTYLPIAYTIQYYNITSSTHTNPTSYTIETPTITLSDAIRTNYTFDGWYDNSAFAGARVTSITKGNTGNRQLYAKWTKVPAKVAVTIASSANSTITVSQNGVALQNGAVVTEGSVLTIAATAANGYQVESILVNGNIINGNSYTIGTAALSISTNITAIPYSIQYGNCENATNTNPSTYTVETATIALTSAEKAAYDFMGWFDNAAFSGNAIANIAKGSTGNKQLWAKWEKSSALVNFTQPSNGTIVVRYNGTPITSGTKLEQGAEISITASVENGYKISTLTLNGVSISNGAKYTLGKTPVTIELTVTATTATTELSEIESTVFPNPVSVNTQLTITTTAQHCKVLNALGQIVHLPTSSCQQGFSIQSPSVGGVYYIQLFNQQTAVDETIKLIVK